MLPEIAPMNLRFHMKTASVPSGMKLGAAIADVKTQVIVAWQSFCYMMYAIKTDASESGIKRPGC